MTETYPAGTGPAGAGHIYYHHFDISRVTATTTTILVKADRFENGVDVDSREWTLTRLVPPEPLPLLPPRTVLGRDLNWTLTLCAHGGAA